MHGFAWRPMYDSASSVGEDECLPEIGESMSHRIPQDRLRRAADMIKCLGHPLRLRLLEAMQECEMTVKDLQEYTGAAQAAVSQQLGILRGKSVVECRREGVFVYYRVIEPRVSQILGCIREGSLEVERV